MNYLIRAKTVTMLRPKAVLFDLDGTLIDTAPEFIEIGHTLRAEAVCHPYLQTLSGTVFLRAL